MLRKPLERLGILTTKALSVKIGEEREKHARINRIHIVENDRTIHELVYHSDACTSEIEYILCVRRDGIFVQDPHLSHTITFRPCECENRINGYRVEDTIKFGTELKHFVPEKV